MAVIFQLKKKVSEAEKREGHQPQQPKAPRLGPDSNKVPIKKTL